MTQRPDHFLRRDVAELKLQVQRLEAENMRLESLMVLENETVRHMRAFEEFVVMVSRQMQGPWDLATRHKDNVDEAIMLAQLAKFVRRRDDRCAGSLGNGWTRLCLLRRKHPGLHVSLAGNWETPKPKPVVVAAPAPAQSATAVP